MHEMPIRRRRGRSVVAGWTPLKLAGYVMTGGLLTTAFLVSVATFRPLLDAFQHAKPQYAAERALEALGQDRLEDARNEVQALLKRHPLRRGGWFENPEGDLWRGRLLRNRVMVCERLAAALIDKGLFNEAEQVLWHALLHYHVVARPVEDPLTWLLMFHAKALQRDFQGAYGAAGILAAHGYGLIRPLHQLRPVALRVRPERFDPVRGVLPPSGQQGLQWLHLSADPMDLRTAAGQLARAAEEATTDPMRPYIEQDIHRALLEAGDRAAARRWLAERWDGDPTHLDRLWQTQRPVAHPSQTRLDVRMLGCFWRDRPSTSPCSIGAFTRLLERRSDLMALDLQALRREDLGFFNAANEIRFQDGTALFDENLAASLDFTIDRSIRRLYLACEADPVLGVFPILLVRFDEDHGYIPVYPSRRSADLLDVDCLLSPGSHRMELIFLNDATFRMDRVVEDRRLRLHALLLAGESQEPSG